MIDITFQHIEANGITHRVATKGEGPLVLLVHGFPESWYSWRHQIEALTEAGFSVAAPDVRGYGGTEQPWAVEAYRIDQHAADMAGIAKALLPSAPAVIVGHDWGAPIAWNSALLHPDQFHAVAGLSVPYAPPGKISTLDLYHKLFTDKGLFFYQVYFQEDGVAEAELGIDPAKSLRRFYYSWSGDLPTTFVPPVKGLDADLLTGMPEPDMPLAWLSQRDLDYYTAQFEAAGFRGAINRYRNHREDHAYLNALPDLKVYQPSLYIAGNRDTVLEFFKEPPTLASLHPNLPGLKECHMLDGCGHWTQQERPQQVNQILINWLKAL